MLKGFDAYEEMRSKLRCFLFQEELTEELLTDVSIYTECHDGGYGKYTPELLSFIQEIYASHVLPLDPIYTAKAFKGMLEELKNERFNNRTILFIHTGGIQVCEEIENKHNIKLFTK